MMAHELKDVAQVARKAHASQRAKWAEERRVLHRKRMFDQWKARRKQETTDVNPPRTMNELHTRLNNVCTIVEVRTLAEYRARREMLTAWLRVTEQRTRLAQRLELEIWQLDDLTHGAVERLRWPAC